MTLELLWFKALPHNMRTSAENVWVLGQETSGSGPNSSHNWKPAYCFSGLQSHHSLRKLVSLGLGSSQMHIILIAKDEFLPGNRLSLLMY